MGSRSICITSAEGHTGHLVTELLLIDPQFSSKIKKLTCLTLNSEGCGDLEQLGAEVVLFNPGDHKALVTALKASGADTIFLIPPAHEHKVRITHQLIQATKEAEIQSTVLLSSAGADLAEENKQPHLREFVKIEHEHLQLRYHADTTAATSQCIIRPAFYAENLLLYNKDAQKSGRLRLPIGEIHSFAPVALGDVAKLAAHILISEGPKGLDDRVRGQLIVLTGPMMVNGPELADVATKAGLSLEFSDISDTEAKQLLDADTDASEAEKQYLLEYYSLVREGKTNYVSTLAFQPVTGEVPTDLPEFFQMYSPEFKPKKRRVSKE